MSHALMHELTHHQYLKQELARQFPDADEETLLDTLEGLTDLPEMIAEVIRSRLDDLALVAALRVRIANMNERLGRFDHRADNKKEIVTSVMERAGLKKLTQPDFTLDPEASAKCL